MVFAREEAVEAVDVARKSRHEWAGLFVERNGMSQELEQGLAVFWAQSLFRWFVG